MPHYRDGTEARIGDVVRGRGYNVAAEIVGTVVGITPGSASCNIQVAHVVTKEIDADHAAWLKNYEFFESKGVIGCGSNGADINSRRVAARACLEYGQCDSFEKVA